MSNTKKILIEGWVSYTLSPPDSETASPSMLVILATMNMPSIGVRIKYGDAPPIYMPNKHGGITAHYPFQIEGLEAFPYSWVQTTVNEFHRAGYVTNAFAIDMEEGGGPVTFTSSVTDNDPAYHAQLKEYISKR